MGASDRDIPGDGTARGAGRRPWALGAVGVLAAVLLSAWLWDGGAAPSGAYERAIDAPGGGGAGPAEVAGRVPEPRLSPAGPEPVGGPERGSGPAPERGSGGVGNSGAASRTARDEARQPEVPAWARRLVSAAQVHEARRWRVPVGFETRIPGLSAEAQMRFVLIPAGWFRMGSPAEETGRTSDETPHEVELTRPYYLAIHEVTNAQYRAREPAHRSLGYKDQSLGDGRQPVVRVTWHEAAAYAVWLAANGGGGRRYRLPTEAEWERAARGGTPWPRRYWWGDSEAEGPRHANGNDPVTKQEFDLDWPGWPADDGHRVTAPVGSHGANPYGLFDTLGNVWEWCSDRYGPYSRAWLVRDPPGPAGGPSRVVRGGSWLSFPANLRLANRSRHRPAGHDDHIGFRLASALPVGPEPDEDARRR